VKDFRQKGFNMGADSKILDDLARVAGGAVNVLSGLQQQIRDEIHSRIDETAAKLDLVPRKELDIANAAIAKLRAQVADLESRVSKMEGKPISVKKEKAPASKAASKKAAAPKKKTGKKK
jgi:BMFP domain-containing protein YqiC